MEVKTNNSGKLNNKKSNINFRPTILRKGFCVFFVSQVFFQSISTSNIR